MQRLFLVIVGVAALTNVVFADIRQLSGTYTSAQIRSACASAGGSFSVHSDGQGYGCNKENCDGKGGRCVVACETKNSTCHGSTPGRISPTAGVADVLAPLNGAVERDPISNSLALPTVIGVVLIALVAGGVAIYRRSGNQQRRPPAT